MAEKKTYKYKERRVTKSVIHYQLTIARGCFIKYEKSYKILEYGWFRKLRRSGFSENQISIIQRRDWLWEHEYRDFMKYAGVECSL